MVNYEILVFAYDKKTNKELTRRSKRDQFYLRISALESDTVGIHDQNQLNVGKLCESILDKCPILINDKHSLEELRLNLIYLIKRKRDNVKSADDGGVSRPASSMSIRMKSASSTIGQQSKQSTRLTSASNKRNTRQSSSANLLNSINAFVQQNDTSNQLDIYDHFVQMELENDSKNCLEIRSTQEFIRNFAEHLTDYDTPNQTIAASFDAHLEGLYGDTNERLESIISIKKILDNEKLFARVFLQSSNCSLLVCALLRTLKDSRSKDEKFLREFILFCLIKFSQYEDVLRVNLMNDTNSNNSSIDLIKICLDLLEENAKQLANLASNSEQLSTYIDDNYFILNSFLSLLENLVRYDILTKTVLTRKKLLNNSQRLLDILSQYYAIFSKTEILLAISQGLTNSRLLLSKALMLLMQLSNHREFIDKLRLKSALPLLENLIQLFNQLQVLRTSNNAQSVAVVVPLENHVPQSVANELYELEILTLRLLINLIYDQRIANRLIKRSAMLKCVLRNLVCFMAIKLNKEQTNENQTKELVFNQFNISKVLLVPFKCLYELSCYSQVKSEIYRSRIIMKCLLDYLLNVARYTSKFNVNRTSKELSSSSNANKMEEINQILFEPNGADHYIIAIWLNLSAQTSLPLYEDSPQALNENDLLRETLKDYIDQIVGLLQKSLDKDKKRLQQQQVKLTTHLIIYLHIKLVRNFSQYISIRREPLLWLSPFSRWIKSLSDSLAELMRLDINNGLAATAPDSLLRPLIVECLAILSNLLNKTQAFRQINEESTGSSDETEGDLTQIDGPEILLSGIVFEYLYSIDMYDTENDDFQMVLLIFIASLAQNKEICNLFENNNASTYDRLISFHNHILENRTSDCEMLICCLYSLSQLMNHLKFLNRFVNIITSARENNQQQEYASSTMMLLRRLGGFMLHNDIAIVELSNIILNKLKQHEEQLSLNDAISSLCRFNTYNSKWLNSVRSNNDESLTGQTSLDINETGAYDSIEMQKESDIHENNDVYNGDNFDDDDDDEAQNQNDLGQLRVFKPGSSGGESSTGTRRSRGSLDDDDDFDTGDDEIRKGEVEEEEEDDEEEEEDGSSIYEAPDLNVIDSKSMYKHLATESYSKRQIKENYQ